MHSLIKTEAPQQSNFLIPAHPQQGCLLWQQAGQDLHQSKILISFRLKLTLSLGVIKTHLLLRLC